MGLSASLRNNNIVKYPLCQNGIMFTNNATEFHSGLSEVKEGLKTIVPHTFQNFSSKHFEDHVTVLFTIMHVFMLVHYIKSSKNTLKFESQYGKITLNSSYFVFSYSF